ncbi:MAG: alkaline phosphatase family protein [Ktedonobacteraceae bacterium]
MSSNRRRMRFMYRIGIAVIFAIGMMVPLAASAHTDVSNGKLKNFQHVFIIMMENTGYGSLIGNPNAPWINMAAKTYGLATNYYGVAHPSQPNYIAATSGSTNGVTGDGDVTIPVTNIVDQIEGSGRTWKAYMQSYALCSSPTQSTCGNQLYERKHNPFISYTDVQTNPARVAKIVDFSQLSTDLANKSVPDYTWISPDQCNDMHGRGTSDPNDLCGFAHVQNLIATGDAFLSNTVNAIMNSQAWNGNSVIFITWDETEFPFNDVSGCCDATPGGGHVVMITISHSSHSPRTSNVAYNHYSMLSTIEGGWSLGCLANTCDTANVPTMSDLVGPKG